jgi:glycerol-3-phosphate dehydrogenase (NAD(P)+)
MEKIAVIGAGSWGTALSLVLANKGHEVGLWVYEEDLCAILRDTRENAHYLPGFVLPKNVHCTHSLAEALDGKSVVLLVLPTHAMRRVLREIDPLLQANRLIINAGKGIETDTLCTADGIIRETISAPCVTAALSGPTFALEIARACPSALVAAAKKTDTAQRVADLFSTDFIKVFTSTDLLGVELGGALKNVIAIATGIADGLNLGYNARAALITRGLVEMKRIGTALGARAETFSGLSGMGDLVLTCTGDLSRNRNVGIQLAQGKKLADITRSMKMVAEGVLTVQSAYLLKNRLSIQASIIDETYRVLYEEKSPQQALRDLLKVETTTEFAGVRGLE